MISNLKRDSGVEQVTLEAYGIEIEPEIYKILVETLHKNKKRHSMYEDKLITSPQLNRNRILSYNRDLLKLKGYRFVNYNLMPEDLILPPVLE